MRALVTGAGGFVGGYLVAHLVEQGDQVVGISRSGTWCPLHADLERQARLERIDLTDTAEQDLVDFLDRKRPEAIYHLAAQSNPSLSLQDPRGTWAINLGSSLNLLEAVRALTLQRPEVPRPRILVVSSGVCYGTPAPEHVPVGESCPVAPSNPYAASKSAVDILALQHWRSYRTPTIVARPFNHAGPGQSDSYVLSSLCKQVAQVEAATRTVVEHGDLSVVRDFTDVRDVVRAYRLLTLHGRPGEVYNIGTGADVALSQLLDIIRGIARVPIPTSESDGRRRAVDVPRLVADYGKLRAETRWSPEIPIKQTLTDMLEYWRGRVAV